MTRWGERCQLPNNSLTTCSMGAGRTPRIRFSSFMVRMDIWSSFAAQRKEMRSLNNTKGCLHSSARSKKRGVCRTKQKITELIPGKKLVWRVLDSNLSFVKEKSEWTGTDIVFEISKKDGKTEVRFTHVGLVPRFQCYGDCSGAWGTLVNENLGKLITMGRVQSDPFE